MNLRSPVGMMLQFAFGPGPANSRPSRGPAAHDVGDVEGEASPQLLALAAAAKIWWEAGRPEGWSLEQHLAEPAAGCSDSAQEQALAATVAQWVRQGR